MWYYKSQDMVFEWYSEKEKANLMKHGISFVTASHVFLDKKRIELYDEEHSDSEDRYITVGYAEGCPISVVYTMRGFRYRIISARLADSYERSFYLGWRL